MKQNTGLWAAHIAAAELEEVPFSEYARRHGLAAKSLYYWRRKLAVIKQRHPTELNPPQSVEGNKFVALQVTTVRQTHCTLSLPSGLRLDMSALPEPEWLAAFDRAVQSVPGLR